MGKIFEMKLNIGCGPQRIGEYLGIDIIKRRGVDVISSALELPFQDASIDAIYSSHVIEHFNRPDMDKLFREFSRVLKSGGELEIICPDFERAMKRWLAGDYEYRWNFGITTLFGKQTNMGQFHYNGFTIPRLKRLLPQYGIRILEIKNQPNRHKRDSRYIKNGDIYLKGKKE